MFANAGPFAEPENALGIAQVAEECGFESLWTVEHTVVPSGYQSQYPYSGGGKMQGGDDVALPDPLIWLAYVGAVTKTIRLATGILILPQRNPLTLAKELATLDRLTGGRVELGVGVGWLQEEFDALGVPWERRGARTDEYVDVLRTMWREKEASYDGEFAKFSPLHSSPKPATATGPKIHIGGHSDASARRAGRIGDGYFPGRVGGDLDALLTTMRKAAADAGRDAEQIEVSAFAGLDADTVKRSADNSVHRCMVPPLAFDLEGIRTQLGNFSENVIQKV
jgi:probable F420-dependent oxidoreductase